MYILGISGGLGHDAAACLVKDGKLIAYAEEERFTRVKHAIGQAPVYSILFCLKKVSLKLSDIDCVALSWIQEKIPRSKILERLKRSLYFEKEVFPNIYEVDHHLAHAAAAYYLSGFKEASILTVDGQGEEVATTVYYAKGKEMKVIKQYPVCQSIGFFYSSVSDFLKLGKYGEGKLMGLAAYGKAQYGFPVKLTDNGYIFTHLRNDNNAADLWARWYKEYFKILKRQPDIDFQENYMGIYQSLIKYTKEEKDFAASAQKTLEDIMVHLAQNVISKTGCGRLIVAGGVGLNCSVNSVLQKQKFVDELFVLPATNDAGTAIGAALYTAMEHGEDILQNRLDTPFLGPSYTDEEIRRVLDQCNLRYEFIQNIALHAAKMVADDKIIGWFQGCAEMGPRALGNRSIVANPSMYKTYNKLNTQVKFREAWRPLAPSVLYDDLEYLFDEADYSPYMLKTFSVREEIRDKVPVIVHADYTTRPQTVKAEDNPLWYGLIANFYEITGIPLVVNTSLNVGGEPICGAPIDCIRTFFGSQVDAMYIGNYVLKKT